MPPACISVILKRAGAFSSAGRIAVSGVRGTASGRVAADGGRDLRILDPALGKEETALHGADLVNLVTSSADGKWMATAAPAGAVVLWDMAARKQERRFELLSWYWHFVDAVWIVVLTVVYGLGQ